MEQELIEDLVIESIRIHGIDVWYLPRTLGAKDELFNEDDLPIFDNAFMLEMYIRNVDGFEGEGDFLSKFGLQIRDSMTLSVAMRTFDNEVGAIYDQKRPNEGDLIYFPLNGKMFELMHVEHESIFYQMGALQMYDLRLELFEYSNERFRTGQEFIDNLYKDRIIGLETADVSFYVKVDTKTANHRYADLGANTAFYIADQDFPNRFTEAPKLTLYKDQTYVFDVSDPSNAGYELTFYDREVSSLGTERAVITRSGTPGSSNATVTFIPSTNGEMFYLDENNDYMGFKAEVLPSPLEDVDNYDSFADNTNIEFEADNILDFSENNPFGENAF
jgi:hypothetical protein